MDFSSQLANLQKTASRAANAGQQNQNHGGSGRGGNYHNNNYSRNDRGRSYNGRGGSRQRSPYHRHGQQPRHAMTEAEEEYLLPRLVREIPKYQPLQIAKKPKQKHIALLFLTIDDLPFENIWRKWLESRNAKSSVTIPPNSESKAEPPLVSIICHAKFPERVKSSWLRQRLLVSVPPKHYQKNNSGLQVRYHTRRPEWGSIDITRAMIDLLDEALKIGTGRDYSSLSDERYSTRRFLSGTDEIFVSPDPPGNERNVKPLKSQSQLPTVDRFIFVSETCMPVSTLIELESALFGDSSSTSTETLYPDADKSWINARNSPNNGYARQLQWDVISKAIPKEKIWKADQWVVLTRHHAWPLITLIEDAVQSFMNKNNQRSDQKFPTALWQCFRHVRASDEMYIPTTLALLGILSPSSEESSNEIASLPPHSSEIARRRITYCDWSMNDKNPASFLVCRKTKFHEFRQVVKLAREEGCLFARKFVTKINQVTHSLAIDATTRSKIVPEDKDEESNIDSQPKEAITGDEWFQIISSTENNKWFHN